MMPITVVLQVTPIIAIAPLITIWVDSSQMATLICAFLVAFFPLLTNTISGLKSTESNHLDLMKLYRANKYQLLRYVVIPNALPYFLSGLKVSTGLALIGAIVAEFFGTPIVGIGFRISTEVGRMNLDMVWAEIAVAALAGSASYGALSLVERRVTSWHPSYRIK